MPGRAWPRLRSSWRSDTTKRPALRRGRGVVMRVRRLVAVAGVRGTATATARTVSAAPRSLRARGLLLAGLAGLRLNPAGDGFERRDVEVSEGLHRGVICCGCCYAGACECFLQLGCVLLACRISRGFRREFGGGCRDRLLLDAAHAGEAAGVGGGIVAARLPGDGFRHRVTLQFGCGFPAGPEAGCGCAARSAR